MSDDPRFFATPDPWGYQSNPCDIRRKQYILHMANLFGPYSRALDIGALEGWITNDLPASTKHGFELSDVAAARFPPTVKRELDGKYDLVLATGVLYSHYNWSYLFRLIREHAAKYVLTCHIKSWELLAVADIGKQIIEMEFPYRDFTQKLRIFDVSSAQNRGTG